jgi:hypothetical protein
MTTKIATVLRSGGDYTAADVQWLVNQLPQGYEILCFTDMAINIPGVTVVPLLFSWAKVRGWWAKIELFRSSVEGDLFYLDLDTVITGNIEEYINIGANEMIMLRDFYHPQYLMSSVMYIPQTVKETIWQAFWGNQRGQGWIDSCKTTACWGDQGFLMKVLGECVTWQDLFPSQFVSYKADIAKVGANPYATRRYSTGNGKLPDSAHIVVFHGKPRPRQVSESWLPPAPKFA